MEWIFWISAAGVTYLWVGYAALVWLAARLWLRPWRKADITPTVTVIISVYNEAAHIVRRVQNCLAQDYPPENLEVIVASDGSTDATEALVRGLADPRVRLAVFPRAGKLATLNRAVPLARGEALVFTDANTEFHPQAVRRLVRSLADETVGCVAGRKVVRTPGAPDTEARYWQYEHLVKESEARLHSVIGADGTLYALRRAWYPFPRADIGYGDDSYLSIEVIRAGRRAVYEPEAVAWEPPPASLWGEYRRKIRSLSSGLHTLRGLARLLVPGRSPVWWQVWSHRVLRLGLPYLLLGALLSSAALAAQSWFYAAAFGLQAAAYALGFVEGAGWHSRLGEWAFRLTVMNFVATPALWRFAARRYQSAWEKEEGR